jgi:hypothetical protein
MAIQSHIDGRPLLYYLGHFDHGTITDVSRWSVRGNPLSWFLPQRGKDLFRFISESIVTKLKSQDYESKPVSQLYDDQFAVHVNLLSDTHHFTVAITCREYPSDVARRLIANIRTCDAKRLRELMVSYQDPKVDKLHAISMQLEETKCVVYESIDKLFSRGEKLEELVEKTDKLSQETKTFYRKARKTRYRWWWCLVPWWN